MFLYSSCLMKQLFTDLQIPKNFENFGPMRTAEYCSTFKLFSMICSKHKET